MPVSSRDQTLPHRRPRFGARSRQAGANSRRYDFETRVPSILKRNELSRGRKFIEPIDSCRYDRRIVHWLIAVPVKMRTLQPLDTFRNATFVSERFRLRPISGQDQSRMYSWRRDARTSKYLSSPSPTSLDGQLAWYDRVRRDPSYAYHIIENRFSDSEAIGFTVLFNRDPTRAEAEWGVVLGQHEGQGLVRIIAPLFCKCAFKLMQLERLFACIQPANRAAIRKMEQIGAVLLEGPHVYRKPGELLFEIEATRFDRTLSAMEAEDSQWQQHLHVNLQSTNRIAQ
jgi:RimJ/RimL family protein N-acetyltransferase